MLDQSSDAVIAFENELSMRQSALKEKELQITSSAKNHENKEKMLADREAQLSEAVRKLEDQKDTFSTTQQDFQRSLDGQRLAQAEIANKTSELSKNEADLRRRTAQLEKSAEEFELLSANLNKERDLVAQKDAGLEQLRLELEKWRLDIMDNREKLEEEVRERVAEVTQKTASLSKHHAATPNDEVLLRREIELRTFEETLLSKDRDIETKERTLAVELERLEKERAEVQDLWNKIEDSKKGIALGIDEKTIAELERRKNELDDMYLKLSQREETTRKDEQRLESEWGRLQSMEEELSGLARMLKSKEDEIRRMDDPPDAG
jgi:DNA repair exonuclease SbcCD ATPase subunit